MINAGYHCCLRIGPGYRHFVIINVTPESDKQEQNRTNQIVIIIIYNSKYYNCYSITQF